HLRRRRASRNGNVGGNGEWGVGGREWGSVSPIPHSPFPIPLYSMNQPSRIDRRFAALKAQGRKGLVTFVTAGDPDYETAREILLGLPGAGADVIELGMPLPDPMADGPAVQASSLRALKAGQTMRRTLELVRAFRARDQDTPIVLFGYYNPIYVYPV